MIHWRSRWISSIARWFFWNSVARIKGARFIRSRRRSRCCHKAGWSLGSSGSRSVSGCWCCSSCRGRCKTKDLQRHSMQSSFHRTKREWLDFISTRNTNHTQSRPQFEFLRRSSSSVQYEADAILPLHDPKERIRHQNGNEMEKRGGREGKRYLFESYLSAFSSSGWQNIYTLSKLFVINVAWEGYWAVLGIQGDLEWMSQ